VTDRPRKRTPRARPVAELPCETLLARADELAKRWVIALIIARPLEQIGELALEMLAHEAPLLCAQLILALQSDTELARLTGASGEGEGAAPVVRIAVIAGARDAAATADAVEALRGVVWDALLDELGRTSSEPFAGRLLVDAGDRLAYVCAAALAAALGAGPGERAAAPESAVAASAGAIIVDERERAREAEATVAPVGEHAASPAGFVPRVSQSSPRATAEIEIRDERGAEGPAAWIRSIGAQLERFERDRLPFAVLLVELVDLPPSGTLHGGGRREPSPHDSAQLAGRLERALATASSPEGELGDWSGSLTRERPGRCWLLAPDTDHAGASALAQRLVRAVSAGAQYGEAPLDVAVGVAVCPEDGREAAALAAHADVGLYAARARVRAQRVRARAAPRAAPVDESA